MRYHFVEVGSCIWNTYIERFGLDVNGLLVEPMQNLFDTIPTSDTVSKENVAITSHDGEVFMHTYDSFSVDDKFEYLGGLTLEETQSMPRGWGASSIDLSINPKRRLNSRIKVKCLTLKSLFNKYDITEIGYFKVDAEGHDHIILEQLLSLMRSGLVVENEIVFEYDHIICNKPELDRISAAIQKEFGFKRSMLGHDVVLTRRKR